MSEVTLKDFDVRYKNILKENPGAPMCSFRGCKNPADDSACAYHRLLFDHWMYEVKGMKIIDMSKRGRRIAFSRWAKKLGKEACDLIVLEMAQYPINWVC